jgi:ATPase subunit of ABC transporter with duplicated ATPase domains
MPSISLSGLTWATPDGKVVIDSVDLTFARERAGLVGRNGVGKTTLLNILAGERDATGGRVTIDGTVWMMRQEVRYAPGATIADLFGVTASMAVLHRAQAGEASLEELADADWTIEERIGDALARVELSADALTPLAMLSGGQRTRASLAAAIFAEPDFLLLDEPTNNLDREGKDAVARLVDNWRGGLIAASHDRELLERMDAIVEMTTLGASRYGGGWSLYRERKAVELEAASRDLAHAQKQQAEVERKARAAEERQIRRAAAGSRKSARGDMPRILLGARKNAAEATAGGSRRLAERLSAEASDAVAAARSHIEVLQKLSIVLPSTKLSAGCPVLTITGVTGGYNSAFPLFEDLDLTIIGPERVAIMGPNGTGKSTLLKLITGELEPLAGQIQVSAPVAIIDQQVAFLKPEDTILDNFKRLNPEASENTCRAVLAGFLFRSDTALQRVGTLSGGQTLRAGLACRLGGAHPPELLILDEPTNHLDIDSVDAIEGALQAYDGALLVVSHDDAFLQNISISRRLLLRPAKSSNLSPARV